MRRAALAASGLAAVLALVAAPARARAAEGDLPPDQMELDPDDYDVGNPSWNGLSSFAQLAAGVGLEVRAARKVDWAELGRNDILVLLYPENELDATGVNRFIQNGGTVIVGDDFGDSGKFLGRLHMLREPGEGIVGAKTFWDDLPYAPVAVPRDPRHPLARGVRALVTNHPAVFTEVGGAQVVFEFGPGEAVVVAGQFGDGAFVVLSDPSVLINGMLQFPGNFEFALNLLRMFAPERGGGRVVILTGSFWFEGEPRPLDDGTLRGDIDAELADVNSWLDELNDWVMHKGAMRILAVTLALGLALLAAAALPLRRGAPLDGNWLRARPRDAVPAVGGDLGALLERYEAEAYRGSYLVPAALVRDAVEARLARALEQPAPLDLQPRDLAARLERSHGRPAAAAAAVVRDLRALPGRRQAESQYGGRFVSKREFVRLHDRARRLLAALEIDRDA